MIPKPDAICLDPQRRVEVRTHGLNGIDYVEVSDDQLTLTVYFLRQAPENIEKENIVISGGTRSQGIRAVDLRLCSADDPDQDDCMLVMVDKAGDFSTYTLRLAEVDEQGQPTSKPLAGLDPRYAQIDFTFSGSRHSDLDCKQESTCPAPQLPAPDINYLAKDYASFRQLLLDRLALIMPEWQERHAPDVGIVLLEILAYVGDYLSYYQDAVATEAYLDTARQRISVRRHARLVDYRMHEGCNARTWVSVETTSEAAELGPRDIIFIAGFPIASPQQGVVLSDADLARASSDSYEVFEPVTTGPIRLYQAHNAIHFYTWRDRICCLPAGATSATLRDEWESATPATHETAPEAPTPVTGRKKQPRSADLATGTSQPDAKSSPDRARKLQLKPGDVLLFEEVIGPHTGSPDDADRSHRHFVRLTTVEPSIDPLDDTPVVEIKWAVDDALPFPLCLSTIGPAPECAYLHHVSIACGNVILVDHGRWTEQEEVGTVPLASQNQTCRRAKHPSDLQIVAGKFRPSLKLAPLTFRESFKEGTPAARCLLQDPRSSIPQIELTSIAPRPDGTGPMFSFGDLNDTSANLVEKLAVSADPAWQLFRQSLSVSTQTALNHFDSAKDDPKKLAEVLRNEMNSFVRHWTPKPDLLRSRSQDRDFVVEMDDSGTAHLRFGNGELGRAPEAGESFTATYRLGNGASGNIGAEIIDHVFFPGTPIDGLTPQNPVAAQGGTAPESLDEVRMFAPGNFLKQLERAITADDYATLAERHPKVQRAAAVLEWTGTRYEARVAIDPLGTDEMQPLLLDDVRKYLYRYRRIGHDLTVAQATYVPLALEISIGVLPDYLSAHVKSALLDVFSNRILNTGAKGFFHPDSFSFGDAVYLSRLVAAAQAVTGVESVVVTRLERMFEGPNSELENGLLPIGPLEVARLDNDSRFPENGTLILSLRGGR
jgi:hypothetical protein